LSTRPKRRFRAHKRLISRLRRPLLRRQLKDAIHRHPRGTPLRIVVGAHDIYEPGWIPTEQESLDLLRPDEWTGLFGGPVIHAILAEHVWEHLTPEQGLVAARTCHRFLEPGGHLRVAVPDGLHPSPEYIRRVEVGGTGPAAWDHKVLYDHRSFAALFERAGFQVEKLEYWDESGHFHAVEWDPAEGLIHRSKRFHRPKKPLPFPYTSLILDARKPAG